ncbi:FFLEELY motif protein [Rhodoblastus sp.]|uniref:FFLEELY motif protein n=1 Tax=Rhodoblastus sp. TaxID=1962975 RepID=UPI003F98C3AE
MSEKDDVLRRLTTSLEAAARLRASARETANAASARTALRAWQASRLARTHADFLVSAEYADAAKFFLSDLYGPQEMGGRDAILQRVEPIMSKTLPVSGLDAIADAIELDALSESLDADMVAAMGEDVSHIDAASYGRAYRVTGRQGDRARQIDLIEHVGVSLEKLAQQRFIGAALAAMRKPARLAGFGDLQAFLERGFDGFRKMKRVAPFLDTVVSRERALSRALFAGDDSGLQGAAPVAPVAGGAAHG